MIPLGGKKKKIKLDKEANREIKPGDGALKRKTG